jgi:hypothetical protein
MTTKQVIATPLLFLLVLGFFISCSDDATKDPVGEDWVSLDTKVYFIDSITVNPSTFKFDSIPVSSTTRLMVGAYTDPVFGLTKCKSFVQLLSSSYNLDEDAVYDSIALILKYDNYFYNDTIPIQNINVFEVLDDIESNDEDYNYYYNTTKFAINSTPIGSKNFNAKPKKEDSLHVTINNTFGKSLFEKIQDNDINNIDEFLKEYKGLLIAPEDSNTAILGFLKSSVLRIYYSIDNETEDDEQTLDFSFNSTNSFHNITSNTQGTVFETLTNQEITIPSSVTSNTTFMQAGTGIATKIDIPYFENIYDIPGKGTIVDANLKISIKQNSNSQNLYTNDSLNVYIINRKAEIITQLTDVLGNTVLGSIESVNDEFNTTTYSIPLKYFLKLKLTDNNKDNLFLAIYPKNFDKSTNRYILNDNNASDDVKLKLELTYAIYDE